MTKKDFPGTVLITITPHRMLNHSFMYYFRAMFCRQAIALSINIKNHFERVLNQQLDRRILVQVTPPYRMPAQLEKWFPTVPSCPQCDGSNSAMVEDVESVDTVGICSKCVHFLEYDEYARSVIQSRGARVYRKRTDRSSSSVGRPWIRTKKARLDECYVPSASTTRSITRKYPSPGGVRVGVRASTRVSTRPGAPRDLSDPFTTGSTLALLKMKRCNVTTRRPVDSDDSSEGGDSRGDFRHGSDEAAAENDRHRDMDFEERYESQYMFDGAFLQRLSTPDLFRCYLGGGDAVDDSLATSASSSGLTISTTEEEARGEEGDGENYINAVTMEDGRSLRDFLVSCYRDGMYPSPGYSTAVAAQHGGQHFLSGGTDEQHPTTSSLKSTGTETDSCFTNDLREQLTEDCSFRLPEPSGATGPAENETDEARATAAGIAEEDLLMLSTILH